MGYLGRRRRVCRSGRVVIAMIEPVTTNLDDIRDAVAEQRLMERALLDFVQEFSRFVIVGRSPAEAIVAIDAWSNMFAKMRRNRK
jgi:hypothetical protein